MACTCEFPITAEEILRGWSGEMSIEEYCGNCGEVFGAERYGGRKLKRKPRPKKRKEPREPVPPLHQLQAGEKFVVTQVLERVQTVRSLYAWATIRDYGWSDRRDAKLIVGRIYRVTRRAWRGRYWGRRGDWNERTIRVEEVGVPHKKRFDVHPAAIEFRREPPIWE